MYVTQGNYCQKHTQVTDAWLLRIVFLITTVRKNQILLLSHREACLFVPPLTCVCHIPHGVFEGPDDGVQNQFELCWWDGQECWETLRVDSLQQVEEMRPVLRELLKVLTEAKQRALKKA